MFTKTFGSDFEASACDAFLRKRGLKPSLRAAPEPERGWILRVDDANLSREARLEFLDFAHQKSIERQRYLAGKEAEFEKLDASLLDAKWREKADLEADEIERLRQVIRRRWKIDRTPAPPGVCPQCHMVGDACTCTRSWF